MTFATRTEILKPSETLGMAAKAAALRAKGLQVISLAAGEPDIATHPLIIEAACEALKSGKTKYTEVEGIKPLLEKTAEFEGQKRGVTYSPSQVIYNAGVKHSLYNLCQVLLQQGDEVIVPAPYWVSYPYMVELTGAKPIYVATRPERHFDLDIADIKKVLSSRTKMLILNSPSNPSGGVLSEKFYADLRTVLSEYPQVWVICDDIYDEIVYEKLPTNHPAQHDSPLKNRVVIVNGMSKNFCMTGFRLGYTVGPQELISKINMLQSHSTSNVATPLQYAALAALNLGAKVFDENLPQFRKKRDHLCHGLKTISGLNFDVPKGAFYVFVDIKKHLNQKIEGVLLNNSQVYAETLLEKAHVASVQGSAFGAEGYLRLSYATSLENIDKAVKSWEEFVRKLT